MIQLDIIDIFTFHSISFQIAKDAKECVQECVSEFISFITSEASGNFIKK